MSKKPILCLDFDGVLHSYVSGWRGADNIPDDPVPGAAAFIWEALLHFDIQIFSSRSCQSGGIDAMQMWMIARMGMDRKTVMEFVGWPTEKPAAMITIDDRAITFTGTWPAMEALLNFKPWNKR